VGSSRAEEAAGERERREKVGGKKNRGEADFLAYLIWTQIYPLSGHKISLYLLAVKEGNLVYTGVKFQPLILLGRISSVGSK
jgi:hypothetical protein